MRIVSVVLNLSKKISIRMDFEGGDARRFEVVKGNRGVKANNELIRVLIADAYNEIQRQEAEKRASKTMPKRME